MKQVLIKLKLIQGIFKSGTEQLDRYCTSSLAVTWRGDSSQCDKGIVSLAAEVVGAQEPLLDIIQDLAVHSIGWPLPLQLEHQHTTALMPRCEQPFQVTWKEQHKRTVSGIYFIYLLVNYRSDPVRHHLYNQRQLLVLPANA